MIPLAHADDTLDLFIFPCAHEEMLSVIVHSLHQRDSGTQRDREGEGEQVHTACFISIVSCIIEKFRKENISLSMVE